MDFNGKQHIVFNVQRILNTINNDKGLVVDGKDGRYTWLAIQEFVSRYYKEVPKEEIITDIYNISDKALALILKFEVGGGERYYKRVLQHPTYPGGASGVTIGIGYDIGYSTRVSFSNDWKGRIPDSEFNRLAAHIGKKSNSAKNAIWGVKDVLIPWESAMSVFEEKTIPKYVDLTLKAWPGSENLHPDAFGALVSIVFNRGSSTRGSRRSEMYNIKSLVKSKDYHGIADEIRSMKRLWVGKGLDGLLTRRDAEADLVESCA